MNDEKAARLAAIRAANSKKEVAAQPSTPAVVAPADDAPAAQAGPLSPPVVSQAVPARPVAAQIPAAGEDESSITLTTLFTMLFAAIIGAFAAVVVLPRWLPGLSASLMGAEPRAYWYLARSSAFVAFGLLWLAMALGLTITSKAVRIWPGGPTVFDIHQFTSLLALAFGLFHGLILLGDAYINFTLVQVLVPFWSGNYRPAWVGLGQVALYVLAVVGLSFYVRSWIGRRAWRMIHFLSFAVFLLALAHGIGSGTDTQESWVRAMYWFSGGSLLFITLYRILIGFRPSKQHSALKNDRVSSSI